MRDMHHRWEENINNRTIILANKEGKSCCHRSSISQPFQLKLCYDGTFSVILRGLKKSTCTAACILHLELLWQRHKTAQTCGAATERWLSRTWGQINKQTYAEPENMSGEVCWELRNTQTHVHKWRAQTQDRANNKQRQLDCNKV